MTDPHVNSNFTVTIDTFIDCSAATTAEIVYRKPGSTVDVSAAAIVVGQTKLSLEITAAVNDTVGKWIFKPYTVIAGAARYGDAAFVNVVGLWAPVVLP